MTHIAKQKGAIDPVIGQNIDFYRPDFLQLVDHIKQRDKSENKQQQTELRQGVKADLIAVGLNNRRKIKGDMGGGKQGGIALAVLLRAVFDEIFFIFNGNGQDN